MLRATLLAQCLATLCYVLIGNFTGFLIVATIGMLAMNAAESAQGPLLRQIGGADATALRATTHAISNLGIALGAVGCGVAVQIGTPDAYRALIIANALSFLVRQPHFGL